MNKVKDPVRDQVAFQARYYPWNEGCRRVFDPVLYQIFGSLQHQIWRQVLGLVRDQIQEDLEND